jgi:hypothetical protein
MNIDHLLQRVKMLERVLISPQAKQRTFDVRVLDSEQRGYVTDAARMMKAIREGSMEETEDRHAFIRAATLLLHTCPPLPKVIH